MDNKLLLIVSIFVSVLLMEQGLQWLGPVAYQSESRTFVPGVGPWRSPNSFVPRPRYSDEGHDGYYTNSRGMVDEEMSPVIEDPATTSYLGPRVRVAFLGDSIVEGVAVPPGNRVTDLIEAESVGRLDVLNFSSSGTGTVQQIAVYHSMVREYVPDLVVLCLFPGNDIANNYERLDESLGGNFLHNWVAADLVEDSLVFISPIPVQPDNEQSASQTIRKLLPATYAHLSYLKSRIRTSTSAFGLEKAALAEGNLGFLSVYREPDPNSLWAKAWRITEEAILSLKKQVEADGAQFVLVILPDPIQSYANQGSPLAIESDEWRLPSSSGKDGSISPFYPHERLNQFAEGHSIKTIALYRSFKNFQDANELAPPYFGFATDGHWSSVGHRVAADSLLPELLQTIRADTKEILTDDTLPDRR